MSKNHEPIRQSALIDNHGRKTATEIRLSPMIARPRKRPTPQSSDESDFDIHAILQILVRRRVWIVACTAIMLAAAALVCILMTPQYEAVSRLELLKQDRGGLSFPDLMNPGAGGFSDALDFNLTLQTQVSLLESDALALQLIDELNLADAGGFRRDPPIQNAAAATQSAAELSDAAMNRRAAILRKLKKNLKVDAISGTRLITVKYTDPDPKLAARIVNQLVSDFVEYNFQVRYNATSKATDFLSQQLVGLKSQVEKAQERAVQLQKDSGIFGQDEQHNIVVSRLEQLNNEVTSAEADRVAKEEIYNLAQAGNPELVAGMLGARTDPAASGTANSLALLTSLRQQEANLNAEYAQAAAKYGSAYPKLMQITEGLTSVRSSIDEELAKVVDRAKREYELAATREAAAKKTFAEQKSIAARMNSKAIDFLIAKHEADSSRVLYEHLLEKLKEADVLAGLRSSQLHVVDPAAVPDRPARPNVPLYLALGALGGMALGVVCVLVVHTMDRTVHNVGEIESATYVPVIGVIPNARLLPRNGAKHWLTGQVRNGRDIAAPNPYLPGAHNSMVTEAFRSLRSSLLLSRLDAPPKVVMITSSLPQEGKSFSSLNLAVAFACNGDKVLLVDADLRRGTLSRTLNQGGIGLTQVLLGSPDRGAYRTIDDVPGLTFMPAGAPCPRPSELLGSQQMAALMATWSQQFAYVLIDTPPLLPVTDAVVLSPKVDAVIVVVRFAVTNRQSIIRTIQVLRDVQAPRLGVLVNAMDAQSPEYYHYFGSYGYEGFQENADSGEFIPVPPPSEPSSKGESA